VHWTIEATDDAREALAPTALVQPLVENAIKYGLYSSPPPLRVRVTARVESGFLVLGIENSGQWIQPGSAHRSVPSTGVGLNSVRRRLALLCGEQATLTVTTPPGLVRLEVRVPYETAPARV
jgi:sensor histidine kinase YesM